MRQRKDKMERRGRNRNHNPNESAKQYRVAQAVLAGYSDAMGVRVAREIVENTSGDMRRKFSKKVKNSGGGLAEATELSEGFHGRKSQYVEDIIEIEKYRTKLAHLGDLVEFEILDKGGKHVIPISFHDENEDYDSQQHVSVASTPDRQQLILGGGDQSLDLDSFNLTDIEKLKDYVLVGEIFSISYFTDKHHLEGPAYQKKGTEYIHKFGEEEGGELPTLVYDRLNYRMLLIGGSYEVRDEGIYN